MDLYAEKDMMIEVGKPVIDVDYLIQVASFIAWHDPNDDWGGVIADDALTALCKLVKVDKKRLYDIVVGDIN